MNRTTINCPKCETIMIRGFIPDFAYGATLVGSWHQGSPKKSFWRRTKASFRAGVPIGAFRCQDCGFLEFYADEKFTAQ
jgi:hypothetical protein